MRAFGIYIPWYARRGKRGGTSCYRNKMRAGDLYDLPDIRALGHIRDSVVLFPSLHRHAVYRGSDTRMQYGAHNHFSYGNIQLLYAYMYARGRGYA